MQGVTCGTAQERLTGGSGRPLGISIRSAWKIQARYVTAIVQAAIASVLLKLHVCSFLGVTIPNQSGIVPFHEIVGVLNKRSGEGNMDGAVISSLFLSLHP